VGGSQQPLAFSTCWATPSLDLLTGDFTPEQGRFTHETLWKSTKESS